MYLSFFRTAKLFFSREHEEQCGFRGVPWPASLLTFPMELVREGSDTSPQGRDLAHRRTLSHICVGPRRD